jgi:HD-GYP domain-containing protein (c-di-GMP phosphodiesterase class II)
MRLVTVSIESIPIGKPLAYPLRDEKGQLLAKQGFVFEKREDLHDWEKRGITFFVDEEESELHNKAFIGKLIHMVHRGSAIGEIANTRISKVLPLNAPEDEPDETGPPDWLDLQVQANAVLRDVESPLFLGKLLRLNRRLIRLSASTPDSCLFALFHLSASEIKLYSATHSMLVSVMCVLAAREVLIWPEDEQRQIGLAALTMNIGMTELQDQLAAQIPPLKPDQKEAVAHHAARAVALLKAAGVSDKVWLDAVQLHHDVPPGPMSGRTPAQRMARLIQRADIYSARLSPRASRLPMSPAAAMQASYFDEHKQVDEAGAALIKAIGIYSPGSLVKLHTQEVAAVVHRGLNTTTPKVAVLINREGMPTVEPVLRDTSNRDYRIVASVPHRDVKLQINLERMLSLTTGNPSFRG